MIRISLTTIAAAAVLIAVSEPIYPPFASADNVRGALCELMVLDPPSPSEDFPCDLTDHQGNAFISSERGSFNFPLAEQGKTYRKQDFGGFIRFVLDGKYALTVYPSGEKPDEPGGF
jgi:hypothetical protein